MSETLAVKPKFTLRERVCMWFGKRNENLFCTIMYNFLRGNDVKDDNIDISDDYVINQQTVITEQKMTMGEYRQKYKWIKHIISYKLLKPFLFIVSRLIGKYMVTKLGNRATNLNLILFDKAFEKSLNDWEYYYHLGEDERKNQKYGDFKDSKYGCHNMLRIMKRILFTFLVNDNAYREFFNMLMYNTTLQFGDYYKNCSEVNHLLYSSKVFNDVRYFKLIGNMNDNYIVQLPAELGKGYILVKKGTPVITDIEKFVVPR